MKNLKYLLLVLAVVLFMPTVSAKSDPVYDEESNSVFANGTSITVNERTDGEKGILVKWDGGELVAPEEVDIFAGAHNSEEVMENVTITMNGGKITGSIFGGGYHTSVVKNSNIIMNGGEVASIMGGGMHYGNPKDGDYVAKVLEDSFSRDTANVIVDEVKIVINGGKINNSVYGGGESYSYTGKSTITVNESFTGTLGYFTLGGSNGFTKEASAVIKGGKYDVVQGVNRGFADKTSITVDGDDVEINNLYAAAEGDKTTTGVRNSAEIHITAGKVENVAPGQNGAPGETAKDVTTIEFTEGTVTNVSDDFDDTKIDVNVALTFVGKDMQMTYYVPQNTEITDEDVKELKADLKANLLDNKYDVVGFYDDEELKTEAKILGVAKENRTVYLKLAEVKHETNPNTADNIMLYVACTVASLAACAYVALKLKKSY